jgi:hypothetical protein
VRLGVIADIHGNELALRGILEDAAQCAVDRWWVLGDLVLFGPAGRANWLLLEDGGHGGGPELTAQFRAVPFDVAAVVRDLRRRRHPNAAFVESVLDGRG